jgi:glycosyltransferase involved in cell wall biosynthesis
MRSLAHPFRLRPSATPVEPAAADKSLLYVSPVMPALHGNGLAMRAAAIVLALATRYRVTLLVFPRYASPAGETVPPEIRAACAAVANAGFGPQNRPILDERGHNLDVVAFDIIHVFRLGTIPMAARWLPPAGPAAQRWLDLDDFESLTHHRVAALHRLHGDEDQAIAEEMLAREADAAEREALGRFDRLFLASPRDLARLPARDPRRVECLPNVLPAAEPLAPAPRDGPYTLLFVGTLDYFPNVDAVLWFGREVLPLIRREAGRAVELRVVGTGWEDRYPQLAGLPGVRLVGRADDLRAEYAWAHAAVVPLRAGGGSRIKAIEAFGLRRPVVGTAIGFEGLDIEDRRHTLIADSADAFALACLELIDSPDLADALAAQACDLARSRYTPERLAEIVAGWD